MLNAAASNLTAWETLKRFARPRAEPVERCELCGVALPPEHDHLIEPTNHKLHCACQACALLFSNAESNRFRRVTRRVQRLPDFKLTDAQWDALLVPINLAFFFHSSPAERMVAMYPSPAGPMESLLTLESWQEIVTANPTLVDLQPDVEALLTNRVGAKHEYYRLSIDKCYELVGLIRLHWRGLSGGQEVWQRVEQYFQQLSAGETHART